jgi:peptidoglycan hydrolase CwlO-like protein
MTPQQPPSPLSKDDELKTLSEQSQKMKNDLEMIQGRIDDLMKKK